MNAPHPLLSAALAMPHTHVVVTRFADGSDRRHTTRNHASAETFAFGERRKIGRDLIDRASGATVRVVGVDVMALEWPTPAK